MGVTVLTLSSALQRGFLGEGQRASGPPPTFSPAHGTWQGGPDCSQHVQRETISTTGSPTRPSHSPHLPEWVSFHLGLQAAASQGTSMMPIIPSLSP